MKQKNMLPRDLLHVQEILTHLYINLLYEIGRDFLARQYLMVYSTPPSDQVFRDIKIYQTFFRHERESEKVTFPTKTQRLVVKVYIQKNKAVVTAGLAVSF